MASPAIAALTRLIIDPDDVGDADMLWVQLTTLKGAI